MSDDASPGGSAAPAADRLVASAPDEHQQEQQQPGKTSSPSAGEPEDARRCGCAAAGGAAQAVGVGVPGAWGCDDEPPSYASLLGDEQQQRIAWSYMFPGAAYEAAAEGHPIARPLVSIPLTSYGIFKIQPPRYAQACGQPPVYPRMLHEPGPAVKSSTGTARKYGAILIAASVIVFLMALSLMVRFVTEKSLWRG